MKDTPRRKAGQPGPVENARYAYAYAQIPTALLCLPTGERSAAIEVWAALHHALRLGTSPQRITDEELSAVPWLIERSRRYRCNGLDTLERLGLITRDATGSSRRVAIVAKLRGGTQTAPAEARAAVKTPKPIHRTATPEPQLELSPEFLELLKRSAPKLYATVHEDAH